jgi:hypothetical protein
MTSSEETVTRYVAKEDIPVTPGGVLAYTRGQTVEADAVEAHPEWKDFVVTQGSKEARQIQADITGRPVEDFDTKTTGSRPAATTSTKES